MNRLIDADKFEAFVIRTNGDEEFVNGVQYVLEKIDNAPTVDAVLKSELWNMRREIENLPKLYPYTDHIDSYCKSSEVLQIIDKYIESEGKTSAV